MALYFNWKFVSLQKQHNLVILLPWIRSSPSLVTSHDQWPGMGVPSLACIHVQGNHLFQMYSSNVIHKVLQSCQSSITSKVEKGIDHVICCVLKPVSFWLAYLVYLQCGQEAHACISLLVCPTLEGYNPRSLTRLQNLPTTDTERWEWGTNQVLQCHKNCDE